MKFETSEIKQVATESFFDPDFSDDSDEASDAPSGASDQKVREEIVRKEKLLGHIDGYLAANVGETVRVSNKEIPSVADEEHLTKLDAGYREWKGRGNELEEKIAALRKRIGEDGKSAAASDVMSPVAAGQEEPPRGFFGKILSGIAASAKDSWTRFRSGIFGGGPTGETDVGLAEPEVSPGYGKKPVFPSFSGIGTMNNVPHEGADVSVSGPGAIDRPSGDIYEAERYPRDGHRSRDAVSVEWDGVVGDPDGYRRGIEAMRTRDAIGFASDRKPKTTYEVEEISVEQAVGNVTEIRNAYEKALSSGQESPEFSGTYAAQAEALKSAYAGALATARFALAAELRGEPEGERRKMLMREFSSVMSGIRGLETASEDRPTERKAA